MRVGPIEDDSSTVHIGRAVRDTQQTVRGTADRVESLRAEMGDRYNQLDTKVDELSVTTANIEGKMDVLMQVLHEDREERRVIRVSSVQAEIELEKTGEIAKLNEAVQLREYRRQRALKVVAAVGPVIAAALTFLISRC